MDRPNAEDLVKGNWEAILTHAGLDSSYLRYREGPCPLCGGTERYRWKRAQEAGFCNGCRRISGFQLLIHILGTDFIGAANFVRKWKGYQDSNDWSGGTHVARVAQPLVKEDAFDPDALRAKYQKAWSEAAPVQQGDTAHSYLSTRVPGMVEIPRVTRLHPGMGYYERGEDDKFFLVGTYKVMLCAAQGLDGRVTNLWRTYLGADGQKAPVKNAKKAFGKFLQPSSAVRLFEPETELGIAEGVENAIWVTVNYGIPCWATLSESGMRKFDVPSGYERVKKFRIFGDNDAPDSRGRRAGNDAAETLKSKLRVDGRHATVILPKWTSMDFADFSKAVK